MFGFNITKILQDTMFWRENGAQTKNHQPHNFFKVRNKTATTAQNKQTAVLFSPKPCSLSLSLAVLAW